MYVSWFIMSVGWATYYYEWVFFVENVAIEPGCGSRDAAVREDII